MKIALDYDDCYTKDAQFWDEVISLAKSRGHTIIIVTCRRDTLENREDIQVPHTVLFTNLAPKLGYLERMGIRFDVWVDDDPACILHGK